MLWTENIILLICLFFCQHSRSLLTVFSLAWTLSLRSAGLIGANIINKHWARSQGKIHPTLVLILDQQTADSHLFLTPRCLCHSQQVYTKNAEQLSEIYHQNKRFHTELTVAIYKQSQVVVPLPSCCWWLGLIGWRVHGSIFIGQLFLLL